MRGMRDVGRCPSDAHAPACACVRLAFSRTRRHRVCVRVCTFLARQPRQNTRGAQMFPDCAVRDSRGSMPRVRVRQSASARFPPERERARQESVVTHTSPSRPQPPNTITLTRPEIKQEDPLDLSILLSGGKETNEDSRSNGE